MAKKWITGILMVIGALTFGCYTDTTVNAYARNVENVEKMDQESCVLDSAEGLDLEKYEEENERLLNLGKQLGMRRTSSSMTLSGVPDLKQSDPEWGACVMQTKGRTISKSGCCLTSFTIIQQYYGGTDTPDIVNEALGEYACPFYYYEAAEEYEYTITTAVMKKVSYENTLNYVRAAVSESHPVLIGMATSTGKTHFVVAYGYDSEEILIRDPASCDYTYLSTYMDAGYYVNRVFVYEE